MLTQAPKGTQDMLPKDAYRWQRIEQAVRNVCALAGYREIRTPMFEHTELFARGVGDGTDVVQKEMYTFEDKGGRSITLKPEGTAGVARAFIENHLFAEPLPCKLYYVSCPNFRYEKPQAGRLRQFHQNGVEVFGAKDASVDAEIIALALDILRACGIEGLSVRINSIGCPNCRQAEALLQKAGVSYRKVVAEESPDLTTRYGVRQAPTLAWEADGQTEKITGVGPIKKFIEDHRAREAG